MGNSTARTFKNEQKPSCRISKLIFLDIDGVLNNGMSDVNQLYVVEEDLAIILKRIIRATGKDSTAIILSSTWRYTETTRMKLKKFFDSFGVPHFISCTPNLGTNRVDEILLWLKENTDFNCPDTKEFNALLLEQSRFHEELPLEKLRLTEKLENITFIVIDDQDLTNEGNNFSFIGKRFIHINKKDGITEKDADLAIRRLNGIDLD